MDRKHFETLEEDYIFLTKCMMKNTKLLIKFFTEEKEIMNEEIGEDILDEVSLFKRAQKMLDHIMKKNNEQVYDALYKGCLHVHAWKAADILVPENAPHEPEEEETYEEHLPEQWPAESHFDIIKEPTKIQLKPCGPAMIKLYQQCINPHLVVTGPENPMYNMARKDKGRLLIIDNENFDSETLPTRKGSNYDGKGLSYLFSNLGFEVHQEANKTKEQMLSYMKEEARKITELSRCSCFILAIMSYGYDLNNGVFGTDGVYSKKKEESKNFIEISEIKKIFALEALTNKPKVFLIVAQQPGKEDYPRPPRRKKANKQSVKLPPLLSNDISLDVPMKSTFDSTGSHAASKVKSPPLLPNDIRVNVPMKSTFDISRSHAASKGLRRDRAVGPGVTSFDCFTDLDGPNEDLEKIPSDADIFLVVVTSREMLMYRDEPMGSWFMQAFIFTMANYAFQKDLREILEKVNQLSASQNKHLAESQEIDYCLTNLTTNKKLYFFPGIATQE